MSTTITAVQSPTIRHAEFITLTVTNNSTGTPVTTTYSFTNAPQVITYNSVTYSPMGGYLGISSIQNEIKSTSASLAFTITGIDPSKANLLIALNDYIKGSSLTVSRGFFDANYQILSGQFIQVYSGIVNQFTIQNEYNLDDHSDDLQITFSCNNIREVLENRISGVKTNTQSWQTFYPNDTSMSRVASIADTYIDFGNKAAGAQSQGFTADTATQQNANQFVDTY